MQKFFTRLTLTAFAFIFTATAVFAVANFYNGFEVDTDGWLSNGGTLTRVSSGTNGVASSDGLYHAEVVVGSDFNGVFTRWGGYENTFPSNGYVTKVDIYLDMALADGSDKRFDYSSAINDPSGSHRRDFIFNVGTMPGVSGQYVMSASNNAPGWSNNPGRDPFTVSQSGWYTFRHTFENNGSGVLSVKMDVLDSTDTVMHTWTMSDPTDVIGVTVGGNRYGWFVTSDFSTLAVDNSEKYNIVPVVGPPTTKNECKDEGWMTFNNPSFKNQGDCVSYVQSSDNAIGNKSK